MSVYTVQLRYPIEQKLKELGLPSEEGNWNKCYAFIGLSDYPIFDELYRQTLNNKIIRAYWLREIGLETFGLFKWHLRRKMHEIMPYYNQLYESEKLIIDPMTTKNMEFMEKWTRDETTHRNGTTDSTTNSTTVNDDRNVFQDTPMNGLDSGAIESLDYATNVTFDNGTTSTDGSANSKNSNEYSGDFDGTRTHVEKGYDKSESELLLTYRKTFLNIDLEIIKELEDLFMQVW